MYMNMWFNMDDAQAMNFYLRALEDHHLNQGLRRGYENDFRAILECQEEGRRREFEERFHLYEFLMKRGKDSPTCSDS